MQQRTLRRRQHQLHRGRFLFLLLLLSLLLYYFGLVMAVGRAVAVVVLFGGGCSVVVVVRSPRKKRTMRRTVRRCCTAAEVERETVLGGDQTSGTRSTCRSHFATSLFVVHVRLPNVVSPCARVRRVCRPGVFPRPERFLCSRYNFDRVRGGSYRGIRLYRHVSGQARSPNP